jgi:hypothetical protein
MTIRFHCPKCHQALQLKENMAGKRIRCPRCHEVSTTPATAVTSSPAVPAPEVVEPIESIATEPAPARAQSKPPAVPEIEAPRSVAQWQGALSPRIESEYQPSGRSSASAVGMMTAGTLLGAALAELAAALALLATWGVYLLLASFVDWMAGATNRVFIILPFLITLLTAVGYGGACALGGGILAIVVVELGKSGKNRSALIPALFSAVATLPVLLSISFWMRWTFAPGLASLALLGESTMADLQQYGDSIIITGAIVVFCLGGSVVAWLVAVNAVKEARYCEVCQEFLGTIGTAHVPIAHAPQVADSLDAHDYTALATHADAAAPTVEEFNKRSFVQSEVNPPHCVLGLYLCPSCGEGYLEASAHAEEIVNTETKQKKEATWKFRSVFLSKVEGIVVREGLFPQSPAPP